MRVVNITEDGRYAGPQSRIAKVAAKLKERHGVETIVLCPRYGSNKLKTELRELSVSYRAIDQQHLASHPPDLVRYIQTFLPQVVRETRAIRDIGPDVVHCNGVRQFKSVIAARLSGSRVIWHLNDTHTYRSLRAVFHTLLPWAVDGLILAGERVRDYYLTRRLRRLTYSIIQAPVETNVFDPSRVRPDATLASLPGLKVVMVGNVNPNKDIATFLRMSRLLENEFGSRIQLVIVGPMLKSQNQYIANIRRLKSTLCLDQVTFWGESVDVKSILKAADIYVCSSRYEASPMAVWEAMSMGLPIVSTDVGDVSNYVQRRRCGFVVPSGDSASLAEKVGLLVDDSALRQQFGQMARQVAIAELDLDKCTSKHDEFYRSVVRGSTDIDQVPPAQREGVSGKIS